MKFNDTTFTLKTAVQKDSEPIATRVTLTSADVPDGVVAAALVSGNSPRVKWQSNWRRNGVPREVTMTWAEWVGKPEAIAAPETPEQVLARAQRDPTFRARMLEMMAQLDK